MLIFIVFQEEIMIIVFYYFKTLLGVCKPGALHTIVRFTITRIHGHTCTD
jgi:hypothetical protein